MCLWQDIRWIGKAPVLTFADEWGSFTPVANQDMDGTKLTNVGPAVLSHELLTVRQIQENYGRYYETGGIGNAFDDYTPAIETYLSGLHLYSKLIIVMMVVRQR